METDEIQAPTGSAVTVQKRDGRLIVHTRITLPVRFITESGHEGVGETVQFSTNGVHFRTPMPEHPSGNLVCYIEGLGRLNGTVARVSGRNIAMVFDTSDLKRDRIADQLIWLLNKDKFDLSEDRRAERYRETGNLKAICSDGREISCSIVNMSLTGVAVTTPDKRPFVGEAVEIGNKRGTVARYVDGGFAVEFTI